MDISKLGGVLLWACALCAGANSVLAADLRIGGTGGAMPMMRLLGEAYTRAYPGARVEVLPSLGSSGGIKAVTAGAIELAVSGRPLKREELARGAHDVALARTPFVFVVGRDNPVEGLNQAQVAAIYNGQMTHWPHGERVRAILRPVGDADSEAVKAISPALRAAKLVAEARPGMQFAVTDQDSAEAMERTPGAFGTATLGQLLCEQRRLKPIKFDGVAPSRESLASGAYPHARQLRWVTLGEGTAEARAFIAFTASAAGRALLQQHGYLPDR